MPTISIIVPIYNVEKYLCYCLDSICNQTFKDWECLLIDDGSTDKSGRICDQYAHKYNQIKTFHKKNGGVADARNYGLKHAIGKYIMYVDGDDWIEADSIERLLQTANENNADLVIGDFNFVYGDKKTPYRSSEWTEDKIMSLGNYISSVWTVAVVGIALRNIYIYIMT